MRLTAIFSDNVVIKDGEAFNVDCSGIDDTIHAVQWYGAKVFGEIEYKADADGNIQPNERFTDPSRFQVLIDRWQVVKNTPPPPPTPEEQAAIDRINTFKADSTRQQLIDQLKTATPDQIKTYINNNVTDLASAKQMLIRLALAVALVVRQ